MLKHELRVCFFFIIIPSIIGAACFPIVFRLTSK